jgi:uncharacterized membrane protein
LGETAVLLSAAWLLYIAFASDWDRGRLHLISADRARRAAQALYGLALLPFGAAHFNFPKETAGLIPAWLPWHMPLAYLTGAAFIVAGLAIIVGLYGRLAAALSTLQMGVFTLLVWVPIVAAGSKDPFQWSETILSWALTAGAWVVTDSYRAPRSPPN